MQGGETRRLTLVRESDVKQYCMAFIAPAEIMMVVVTSSVYQPTSRDFVPPEGLKLEEAGFMKRRGY
jgi:hypothetical protein